MDILRKRTWSPYTAGALAGLLLVLSVFLTGKYFGASTTFVRAAGFVEQSVAPEKVAGMAYFLKEKVIVDWQFLFVVGFSLAPWRRPGSRRKSGRSPCRRCGRVASGRRASAAGSRPFWAGRS